MWVSRSFMSLGWFNLLWFFYRAFQWFGLSGFFQTFPRWFIRLRRRPRALPVDECVRGVGANPEPRYHCFGGFRHWRITLRSLGACVPKRFGAHGRRRVFLWRYHGLSPWGSILCPFLPAGRQGRGGKPTL